MTPTPAEHPPHRPDAAREEGVTVARTRYPNALHAPLGAESTAVSATTGRTVLPLGPHLRHRGALRVATPGPAAEDGTSTISVTDASAVQIAIAVSRRDIQVLPPVPKGKMTDVEAMPATGDLLHVTGISTDDGTIRITTPHPGVLGPACKVGDR